MKIPGKTETPMFAFWATPERQAELKAEEERIEAMGPDGNEEWAEALRELMEPQPHDLVLGDTARLIGSLAKSGSVELPTKFTTTGPDGKVTVNPVKFSASGRDTVKKEIQRLQNIYLDPGSSDTDKKAAEGQARRWFSVLYPGKTSGSAFIAETSEKDIDPGHTTLGSRAVGDIDSRVNLTGKNYRHDDPRGRMQRGEGVDRHEN